MSAVPRVGDPIHVCLEAGTTVACVAGIVTAVVSVTVVHCVVFTTCGVLFLGEIPHDATKVTAPSWHWPEKETR